MSCNTLFAPSTFNRLNFHSIQRPETKPSSIRTLSWDAFMHGCIARNEWHGMDERKSYFYFPQTLWNTCQSLFDERNTRTAWLWHSIIKSAYFVHADWRVLPKILLNELSERDLIWILVSTGILAHIYIFLVALKSA